MGFGAKGYHLVEHCTSKAEAQRLVKLYRGKGWKSVRIQKGRTYPTSPWYYSIYAKGREAKAKRK